MEIDNAAPAAARIGLMGPAGKAAPVVKEHRESVCEALRNSLRGWNA